MKGLLNITVTKAVAINTTSVTVPVGGCSQLITATLPFVPTSTATLLIKFASGTNSGFTTSPSSIIFSNTDTIKSFSICSAANNVGNTTSLTVEVTSTENLFTVATASRPGISFTMVAAPSDKVTIPTSINVPRSGCSSTQSLSLTNNPVSDLIVTFDSTTLKAKNLYLYVLSSNSHSDTTISFTNTGNSTQSFKICSFENSTASTSIQIPVWLDGTNNGSYIISGSISSITVNISTMPSPSVTISLPSYYDGGVGTFSITTNIQGNYLYSLRESKNASDPYNFSFYYNMLANNNYTIESQSDFLTKLYVSPRNFIVSNQTGLTPEIPISKQFYNMLPETTYSLCGYYQNVAGNSFNSLGCQLFTTPDNATYIRLQAVFTFNSTLNDT